MQWGHVGREVLIKLAPADWARCRKDKLYQVVIMLDRPTNNWNKYFTEMNVRRSEVSQLLPVRRPAEIFKLY